METKDIIIKKTFDLLLKKGYDAVSITDIQQATGMSRGLLYHYFKNREDLFIQVTEKYFVKIFDFDIRKIENYSVFEYVDFLCKRFKKIAKTISESKQEGKDISKIPMMSYNFLFYQVLQKDIIFRNRYKATISKEHIGWEHTLKNSINNGEIKADIDISFSATQLFTLTDGIWYQSIYNDDAYSLVKELKTTLLHYIKLLQ